MHSVSFRGLACGLLVLSAVGIVGCDVRHNPSIPPDPSPTAGYLPPISPENVLENFMQAHRRLDIEAYDAALDASFLFRPDPSAENVPHRTLSKAEDLPGTERMFAAVASIEIRLDHAGAVASDRVEEYPPDEGYMQISVPDVHLEVHTATEGGNGPTYVVSGRRALFMFKEFSGADGAAWRIVMQEEQR